MDLLLDELKSRLRITWNDEDETLKTQLSNGKAYLSEVTGASFDYEKEESAKELLIERCRYVYNNAADEFEANFQAGLSRLILKVAIGKAGVINESTS